MAVVVAGGRHGGGGGRWAIWRRWQVGDMAAVVAGGRHGCGYNTVLGVEMWAQQCGGHTNVGNRWSSVGAVMWAI